MTKMWGNSVSWKIEKTEQPHEAGYLKLDCSKAKSKIGWYPRWNIELGLEKTVAWYKAHFNNEDLLNISLNQIVDYEKSIII